MSRPHHLLGSEGKFLHTILAVSLALLASYNYAAGIYGGAIVSGIGTILLVLFTVLSA